MWIKSCENSALNVNYQNIPITIATNLLPKNVEYNKAPTMLSALTPSSQKKHVSTDFSIHK
jgi:hypothetical protein